MLKLIFDTIVTQDDQDDRDQDEEDEEDEESEENCDMVEEFFEDLTLEEQDDAIARVEQKACRNPSSAGRLPGLTGRSGNKTPRFNLALVDKYMIGGWTLVPGMFVELLPEESLDKSAGDFILIDSILEDMASEEVFLCGTRFRRTYCLKGMLEKKLNEIYMVQRHEQQDPRIIEEQSFEEVPVHFVLCVRKLITTNQPYPNCSWRVWNPLRVEISYQTKLTGKLSPKDRESVKERAQLVCRFKYTIVYGSPANQRTGRMEEQRLERITQRQSDTDFAMSDQALRILARSPDNDSIVDLTKTKDKAVESYRERLHDHRCKQGHAKAGPDSSTAIDLEDDDNVVVAIKTSDNANEKTHTFIESPERVTNQTPSSARRSTFRRRTQETLTVTPSSSSRDDGPSTADSCSKSVPSTLGDDFEMLNQPPRDFTRRLQQSSRRSSSLTPTSTLYRYTFGDGFSGAGGISRGATDAGLDIKWAFDMWDRACHTYRRNFRNVRIFKKEAFDFIIRWRDTRTVDILHLSPPCQKFSPAHTVQGKDDDANEASLFAVGCIIQKAKPRVVTIEETSGIKTHHPIFLHALILQLTRLGYSVAWKVMNFAEYGLAQPRKRLIIIASW